MTPDDIDFIRQALPDETQLLYYPDRESAWVLARSITDSARVSELKTTSLAKFLGRPLVKPVVAASGGLLRRADLCAVANADTAHRLRSVTGPARAGLNHAYALGWQDYLLSYAQWGLGETWQYHQLSRKGGNLVLQLGFPSDHAAILGRSFRRIRRSDFEYCGYPVRTDGRPTLAWVRLDIDLLEGIALVEEVQCDWLRWVAEDAQDLALRRPRSREAKSIARYAAALTSTYAKTWPVVALFAALRLMVDELGVRQIWMHQPAAGAVLKGIRGTHPPRSLYTSLPKHFGFQPTCEVPPFLSRPRRRALSEIAHFKSPLFWLFDVRRSSFDD